MCSYISQLKVLKFLDNIESSSGFVASPASLTEGGFTYSLVSGRHDEK